MVLVNLQFSDCLCVYMGFLSIYRIFESRNYVKLNEMSIARVAKVDRESGKMTITPRHYTKMS
jgi:hypothetical protein